MLYVDAVVFALTGGLMIVSVTEEWATPWPHVLAALAGAAIPQIGTMVRGRWAHLLPATASGTPPSPSRGSPTRSCSSPARPW